MKQYFILALSLHLAVLSPEHALSRDFGGTSYVASSPVEPRTSHSLQSVERNLLHEVPRLPDGHSYTGNRRQVLDIAKESTVDAFGFWTAAVSAKKVNVIKRLAEHYGEIPNLDYKHRSYKGSRIPQQEREAAGNTNYGSTGWALFYHTLKNAGVDGFIADWTAELCVEWLGGLYQELSDKIPTPRYALYDEQFLSSGVKFLALGEKWNRTWTGENEDDAHYVRMGIELSRFEEVTAVLAEFEAHKMTDLFSPGHSELESIRAVSQRESRSPVDLEEQDPTLFQHEHRLP